MLREKIAKQIYIWKTKGVVIDWIEWEKVDEWVKEVYRKEADQILTLFRAEIEKLGVISDKKITKAIINIPDVVGVCVTLRDEERAVAQAQLQDSKDTLLRRME